MSSAPQSPSEIRTITAAEFKAKCLQLMDEVNEKHITLVITKRGKPVMEASAPRTEMKPFRSLFGRTPGPVPSDEQWAKMKAEQAADWEYSDARNLAMFKKRSKAKGTKA